MFKVSKSNQVSPQMGTLCDTPVTVGFKKGPQYLLKRLVLAVVQRADEPKK